MDRLLGWSLFGDGTKEVAETILSHELNPDLEGLPSPMEQKTIVEPKDVAKTLHILKRWNKTIKFYLGEW